MGVGGTRKDETDVNLRFCLVVLTDLFVDLVGR